MPALSEYLGALLAEITNARLHADLESVRIAQLYASHPLLQHFAIPRFRLPNVTLDLPIAVEKITQPPSTTPRPSELLALRPKINAIIEQELNQLKLELPPNLRKRLMDNLNRLFEKLKTSGSLSPADAIKASDAAVTTAVDAIKAASKGHPTVDFVESSLRRQFATEFLKLQPPPPQVQVLVVTAQLKDVAPPLTLTRIRLTISEEGVEWTQTNPSDSSTKTLLPE